jgi:hypothetical protein
VSERELTLAKEGLEAWRQGDFGSIESLLDPGATWRAFEPGEWDCVNRDDILRTLRERHEQGFARGELEVLDGGPEAVIVVSHPRDIGGEEWPEETATSSRSVTPRSSPCRTTPRATRPSRRCPDAVR